MIEVKKVMHKLSTREFFYLYAIINTDSHYLMKIAIIGAHSTGKTTLLNHLNTRILSEGLTTIVLPEYARLCPFPIDEKTTLDAQQWIQEQQMNEEYAIDHTDKILLCDRATIDNFAYFLRAAQLQGKEQTIEAWERKAAEHMASYDMVFKTTKLHIAPEDDGKRSTNEEFRNEIDILIHELLRKHAIPYVPLPQTLNYDTHLTYMMNKLALPIPSSR